MKHAALQRSGISPSGQDDHVMFDRSGRDCSRGQGRGNAGTPAWLARQPVWTRQNHKVHHRRADQELFFRSADAAQVKPPHAVLALGVSEEPFDPAPQPHRPLVEAGFYLGSGKIADVLIIQTDQSTTPRRCAFLPKHARLAIPGIRGIAMHAGGRMEGVVRERLAGRADKAVGIPIIAEGCSWQLALGLLRAVDRSTAADARGTRDGVDPCGRGRRGDDIARNPEE